MKSKKWQGIRGKWCLLGLVALLLCLMAMPASAGSKVDADGKFRGIWLGGKVKVVEHGADIKVKTVTAFEDLRVQVVTAFPDKLGKWQYVDSFPDFTIQFVDAFEDIRIKFVTAFPGRP